DATEEYRVSCRPLTDRGVVVPGAKAEQSSRRVVEAAGEAEGLEAGVAVGEDVAERVVVQGLLHDPCLHIHDAADAAEVVTDEAVGAGRWLAGRDDHQVGYTPQAIGEDAGDLAEAVLLDDR